MAYIVNGKKVEHLHIEKDNGDIIVNFDEKFNILTAHISDILQRTRDNNLSVFHVSNYIRKYKLVLICFTDIGDVHGILYALDIPHDCYDVVENDGLFHMIVIDTDIYSEKMGFVK